jgi:ArsR family transcriptional regulator, arsenate/arsenite/antimonite-responsive transcriptional repressor
METGQAVVALEALAQESRLAIYRLLVEAGPTGLAAGSIAERMKLPAPTLSFHLAQLKHGRLIDCRRNGRSLIYSANFQEMNDLVLFLTENCCGTGGGACAPACGTPPPQRKRKPS